MLGERGDQVPALGFDDPDPYFDAGRVQASDAAAGNPRVGIDSADADPTNAGGQYGFDARSGTAMVGAGFEGNEKFGAAGIFSSLAEGEDLGMRLAGPRMIPFSDHLVAAHDDRADRRIGTCASFPQSRQFEGARHVTLIPGHVILQAPGLL
jgi:hypothetical protein